MEITVAGIAGPDIVVCSLKDNDNSNRGRRVTVDKSYGIASLKVNGRGRHWKILVSGDGNDGRRRIYLELR